MLPPFLVRFCRSNLEIIAAAIVSIAAFANSLSNQFAWDDKQLIVINPYILDGFGLKYWFGRLYLSTDNLVSSHFYRPLPGLTFSLDAYKWGIDRPFGFHLTNLIIFTLSCIVLCLLVRRLTGNRLVAAAAGLIFAVHPVHSEPVAWVSGRTDLLCGLFMMLSVLLFVYWADTGKNLLRYLSAAALALALLSKEVAVVGLIFLLAAGYLKKPAEKRWKFSTRLLWIVPHAAVTAGYLVLRQIVINKSAGLATAPVTDPAPFAERLMGAPVNIVRYIKMLVVPESCDPYYAASTVASPADLRFIASLAAVILMIVVLIWFRRRSPVVFWSGCWFFATLLPALNIVQMPGTTMAERLVYIPSIGAAAIAAMMGVWLWRKAYDRIGWPASAVCAVVLLALIVSMTGITWKGNKVWSEDYTLWQEIIRRHPEVAYAHNGLGSAYAERALTLEAIEEFREALRLRPNFASAHINLANVLANEGRMDEAQVEFENAIKDDSKVTAAYIGLSQVHLIANPPRTAEAIKALEDGHKAIPKNPVLAVKLAELYVAEEVKLDRAVELLENLVKNSPDAELPHLVLGKAYARLGRKEEAREQFEWVIENSRALEPEARGEIIELDRGERSGVMGQGLD